MFQSELHGFDDAELTQQMTPIFYALTCSRYHRAVSREARPAFRDDSPTGPQPTVSGATPVPRIPVPTRALLRAVPAQPGGSGGAHRAEVPVTDEPGDRAPARSTGRGAHRAPEDEQPAEQPTARRATSRGGRHRPLRPVVH